jgi:hypothetical protein
MTSRSKHWRLRKAQHVSLSAQGHIAGRRAVHILVSPAQVSSSLIQATCLLLRRGIQVQPPSLHPQRTVSLRTTDRP